MRFLRFPVVAMFLLSLSVGAFAAEAQKAPAASPAAATAPAAMPKAGSVLEHIPAGAMGYVVVNSVQGTMSAIDKFVEDIGMGAMAKGAMPNGTLALIKELARLGDGFNPNGGCAAVMLDPAQYGVDLAAMMGMGDKPAAGDQKPPFVILIPGASVKALFSNYKQEEAGKYTKVALRMGDMLATQLGGYVAIAPTEQILAGLAAAETKAGKELSKENAEVIGRADVAIRVNMKMAGPIIMKAMKKAQEMGSSPMGMTFGGMAGALGMYNEMLPQLDALTLSLRIVPTGLTLEEFVVWAPDSMMGKMMAGFKPAGGNMLDRVPNLPYVLAATQSGMAGGAKADESVKLLDTMLSSAKMANLPADAKEKLEAIVRGMNDQIVASQFFAGAAPDTGLFGACCVIQCKDAAAVRGLMAQGAALAVPLLKALLPADAGEELGKLQITYNKEADTVGDAKVDTIAIQHPELASLDEKEKAEMVKILGEDQLRVLVAQVDAKTVVLSFGGGKPFMVQAMKAAKDGGGKIMDAKEVQEAMKYMPKNPAGLVFFNAGTLYDIIVKAVKIGSPDVQIPFAITAKTPVAFGVGVEGANEHVVVYVPTDLVKDGVGVVMGLMMQGAMGGGSGAPMKGANDF